jgi:hypothetical protein
VALEVKSFEFDQTREKTGINCLKPLVTGVMGRGDRSKAIQSPFLKSL